MCEFVRACVRVCECTAAAVCLRECSLINPARNAPLYCHLRPLWLHQIFRLYLISDTIFGKKLLNIKYVFQFSLKLSTKTFLTVRITKPDIVINVKTYHNLKYRYSCRILMKLGFSLQLLFETSLILLIIQRDIVINVKMSSCKVPVILGRF